MRESDAFRSFVLDDYTKLLSGVFDLVEEIAFAPLERRLAWRLLVEADADGIFLKTHQQLAPDVSSVREVVSRLLGEWADTGLVEVRRGQVQVVDRTGLASGRSD